MLEATLNPTAPIPQSSYSNGDIAVSPPVPLPQSRASAETTPPVRSLRRVAPILAVLVASMAIALTMLYFRESLAQVGNWGYLAVFVAELGNAAMILIPTPTAAYTFSMGGILNPIMVGLIGGVAATVGESTGYYLGIKGRQVIEKGRWYERLESVSQRWGGRALFAFALLPVPFDVAGMWAGSVRYPLWRFFAIITPGKIIKVTTIVMGGYYGINWIAGPLG